VTISYLGPPGTWSEAAVLADPVAAAEERRPEPTIHEAIDAVARGETAYGIAPIQNSLEGGVNVTLDTLVQSPGLEIVGETVLAIHHCLIAKAVTPLHEIQTVVSHPQATAQCRRFLRDNLPRATVVTVDSTAQAVLSAVEEGVGLAAIGTSVAADMYGAVVLREGIEDEPGNVTRFVWVAPGGTAPWPVPDGPRWKTSLVFWGEGDGTPGWLVRCLAEFSDRELNLSRIESRPRRGSLDQYLFFVDLETRGDEPALVEALAALHGRCESVRVLGSYPSAPHVA
jgi:prephenate dehydratase